MEVVVVQVVVVVVVGKGLTINPGRNSGAARGSEGFQEEEEEEAPGRRWSHAAKIISGPCVVPRRPPPCRCRQGVATEPA
ncbi:hypothetical protein E2C01_084815 [Portunus trituberculatus]|uniref:Uncharacterized protein n=1 Tax=Portunus trituberculatus TaxID=210409 RepID=A0A5B7J5T0_PORTR|nr:hypothetical protein [Portunus trituberculatus]